MTFVSVIIALIFEQFRPLPHGNPVYAALDAAIHGLERNMNAGERRHGVIAWWILMGTTFVVMMAIQWGVGRLGFGPSLLLSVCVLFLTLGFRQFSHPFTEIQTALDAGNLAHARQTLGNWMSETYPDFAADKLSAGEVARYAIERALMLSHRHVFGVFFWYVLLGPTGAVLYRLSHYTARVWSQDAQGEFAAFAQRIFGWIDWVPVRLTAIGFAIVGNFEDAMFGWRNYASRWRDPLAGVVLAAGGGALGVRLGGGRENPIEQHAVEVGGADSETITFDLQPGVDVEPAHLRSAVGLVWRAMVLWVLLLLLLSIASWTS